MLVDALSDGDANAMKPEGHNAVITFGLETLAATRSGLFSFNSPIGARPTHDVRIVP